MHTSSHVVAVTRWNGPFDRLVAPLATLLARDSYEMRTKLVGPLPLIVATTHDAEMARAAVDLLRGAGHGVVSCDASDRDRVPPAISFERIEVLGDVVVGTADRVPIELPLAHVQVVIEATHVSTEGTSAQLSHLGIPSRRGLGMMAVAQTGRRGEKVDVERVLYLARASESALLVAGEARTQFVGSLHRSTRRDSFAELLRLVRERAPRAAYDPRLASQKRPATTIAHANGWASPGGGMPGRVFVTQTERASNVSGTDLAAHLLALAHRSRQA